MSFAVDLSSRKAFPLEAKFVDGVGEVEGYAATFGGMPDSYGDVIAPGAFSDSLQQHSRAGSTPAMLWAHDQSRPIGKWQSVAEDSKGLHVRGKLNLSTEAGRDAHAHLKHGDVSGLSIGFSPGRYGRERHADGTATLKRVALHEISVVTIPANRSSRVLQVKAAPTRLTSQDDLEDLLMSNGIDEQMARTIATKGWAGLSAPDPAISTLLAQLDANLLEIKSLRTP